MKYLILFYSFLILSIGGCKKESNVQSQNSNSEYPEKEGRKIFPDRNKFKVFLGATLRDSTKGITTVLRGDSIFIGKINSSIYRANDFNAFWADSAQCNKVIRILSESRFDGLLPSDYGMPGLATMSKLCFVDKKVKDDTLFWKLEIAVSKNYLKYLNHLRFGKVNPETVTKDWDYKRDPALIHTPAEFVEYFKQEPANVVTEFRPQLPMYNILRGVLFKLDSIGKNNTFTWDRIPYIGKDLQINDTSHVISKVKLRLLTVIAGQDEDVSNVFNEGLLTALNYFQKHAGLTPNGKIDKATIARLNFTLQETKDLVRVNMERCRWLLIKGKPADHYIVVNVADYSLRIYKNQKQVYRTRVVVGATDKETPLFHSRMTTIELNPNWTVPYSISGEEILPRLKKDPNFLSRNNMELIKGDEVVEVTDFSAYTKDNFPFKIRQKPGKDNALGLIKFLFPNPYFIYFHDTPSKSLFEKDTRAASHGCIRVQKPLDLAAFILEDEGYTRQEIVDRIDAGENYGIALKTKIPVIITYWTCFTDTNNQVFFLKDIYGRDQIILKELNKSTEVKKLAKGI